MSDALFELARFQLKAAALSPGTAERMDDAYVFAWDAGIYPIFHQGERLHEVFAAHFEVTDGQMRDLMTMLDEAWMGKTPMTFDELERQAGSREDDGNWTRSNLVSAVRYAFLSRRFDAELYQALLRPGGHPLEASSLNEPYDREFDLTLP